LIQEFEKIGVDCGCLNFVFYGLLTEKNEKAYAPFIVTAKQFIEMQIKETDSKLIQQMKIGNYIHIF
jgi:hypothetical protein